MIGYVEMEVMFLLFGAFWGTFFVFLVVRAVHQIKEIL